MLKEFDEFVNFCFEHGGTLRNHKQFGEMARMLREKIAEQESRPTMLEADSCPYCAGSGFRNLEVSGVVECIECKGTGRAA